MNTALNKLANNAFLSDTTTTNKALPKYLVVTGVSNATPIRITTSTNHGMATGAKCQVDSVGGNVAANGYWTITNVDATHFDLNCSVGSGAYTSGGNVFQAIGQPQPPGALVSGGQVNEWEVWRNSFIVGTANIEDPQFVSDGTIGTGEIVLKAPSGTNTKSGITQRVWGNKFSPTMHLTLSVFAKIAAAASDTDFEIEIEKQGTLQVFKAVFHSSLLTTAYQRFVFTCALSNGGITAVFANIRNVRNSGTGQDITIAQPVLNVGDQPAMANSFVDTATVIPGVSNVTPAWQRPVAQLIVRDASAPYA